MLGAVLHRILFLKLDINTRTIAHAPKYIKVISAMYKKNTAAVKVGNEISSWFRIKSGVKQGCVLYPYIWIILIDFVLNSPGKTMGELKIKWNKQYPRNRWKFRENLPYFRK